MALDSDEEWIRWHRPASSRDALHQVCTNFPLMIISYLASIGEFVWNRIIKRLFICSCFRLQPTHQNGLNGPTPMSTLRKRPLKLDNSRRRVAEQSTSALYSKLPPEIRTLIFEFALFGDGNVVHVYKRGKRMTHFRCKRQLNNQPCTYASPCSAALPFKDPDTPQVEDFFSPQNIFRFYDSSRFDRDTPWAIVPLMRTCRQVYYDVASLLYTKTHFHFPHSTDLSLFSGGVGTRILETIKIVSFDVGDFDTGFSIEASDQVSAGTSTVSSGLKGLKELRVYVKRCVAPTGSDTGGLRRGESIGGMVLGCNIKEREGLDVFQVIVPGRQYKTWETLLAGKRGIELCVYRDDKVPEEVDVVADSTQTDDTAE